MARTFILVLLILLQAGCSSLTPPASSPTPSPTPLPPPSPTRTLTPAPTAPALSPEVQDLQKSLDGTAYGLTWNEDKTALTLTYTDPETNEKTEIEEIAFDKDGKMTVSHNENEFEAQAKTVEVHENDIYFKDITNGMGWKFSGETKLLYPEIDKNFDYPSLKDSERFHYIDFDTAIYDPAFDARLIGWLDAGLFPEMSPKAVPFERVVAYDGQSQLDLMGNAPAIAIPTDIALKYRHGDKDKVPVQLAAVYQTTFYDGTPMFIFIAQWKDTEGIKLVKYTQFDRSSDFGDDFLWKYVTEFGFDSTNNIPSGTIYQKDSEKGDGAYNVGVFVGMEDPQKYSNWYFRNEELLRNEELIKEWSKSGIIKNKDEQGNPDIPVFIYGAGPL
ncbi:MAG: hypothetical protein HND47_05460 [Chloroflexi bacterium]|nr:hypothetical protein [Chloroflexota bacterium]